MHLPPYRIVGNFDVHHTKEAKIRLSSTGGTKLRLLSAPPLVFQKKHPQHGSKRLVAAVAYREC